MDNETVLALIRLNNEFYRCNADSFSETRSAPWDGWKRCLDVAHRALETQGKLSSSGGTGAEHLSIFDLAAGNFRFESYVSARLPDARLQYYTVDNCDELAAHTGFNTPEVNHQSLDILDLLQKELPINDYLEAPLCDMSVSFGFLHHVPSSAYRRAILQSLVEQTAPGGLIMVSFWQFMKNEQLKEKAFASHQMALEELKLLPLEENDYLLGWQNRTGVYRYCHSFTNEEIDELLQTCESSVKGLARFTADGRTDDLNTYLIMQRN